MVAFFFSFGSQFHISFDILILRWAAPCKENRDSCYWHFGLAGVLSFNLICVFFLLDLRTDEKLLSIPKWNQIFSKDGSGLLSGNQILLEKGLLQLPTKEEEIDRRLKKLIHSSQTMLFMKGTPDEPRCGFSNKVVSALREEGVEFSSFDILTDEEVRQGLKIYSNWPTYPQLYHKGELLGGCDIVLEMKESGELRSTLEG